RAELGGQVLFAADALARNPGVEEVRTISYLDRNLRPERNRVFQQALADIAPRADDVGYEIDGQRGGIDHGAFLKDAAKLSCFSRVRNLDIIISRTADRPHPERRDVPPPHSEEHRTVGTCRLFDASRRAPSFQGVRFGGSRVEFSFCKVIL